ncbi:MAG TPA: sulfite exporter TauE/SafE family protein [Solirubrobacterales bacterium]
MDALLSVPFGIAIGLVVGAVGGGGAILALPVLVYVLGQGVGPATTASLVVVAVAAAFGAGSLARDGRIELRLAAVFSIPAAAGAYLGTLASDDVDPRALVVAFIPVMLAAAAAIWLREGSASPRDRHLPDSLPKVAVAATAGLGVGVLTGFFGVGGGFLIVPALTVLLGLELHRAVATSLVIIAVTGCAALASHLAAGAEPDWALTAAMSAATALGALAGSRWGRRLSARSLAHGFAAIVAAVAVFLLVDALLLGGPPVG